MAIPLFILFLLTFGFLVFFASDKIVLFLHVDAIRFYGSFVSAFFLLAMAEQIND